VPVSAYCHGIFPRSDGLIRATRDWERGRVEGRRVEDGYRDEAAQFVALQRRAGMDYFSDGLIGWPDLFRPVVEACRGLEPGGLVRWFDTNSFYRAPVASGPEPALRDATAVSVDAVVPAPRVATLPSPLLFSRVVLPGAGVELDRDSLVRRLATEVLRPVVDQLVADGCRLVHLEEPWVVTHRIEDAAWEALASALADLRAGLEVPVVLHTSFGDAGAVMDRLRRLPVDALGVDLVETDLDALVGEWDIGLVVGCLNGRSSLVESVELSVKVAEAVCSGPVPRHCTCRRAPASTCCLATSPPRSSASWARRPADCRTRGCERAGCVAHPRSGFAVQADVACQGGGR
jgi:5-methyltetrahydropteroyltriglutamate--homocysteine methyltransferase